MEIAWELPRELQQLSIQAALLPLFLICHSRIHHIT